MSTWVRWEPWACPSTTSPPSSSETASRTTSSWLCSKGSFHSAPQPQRSSSTSVSPSNPSPSGLTTPSLNTWLRLYPNSFKSSRTALDRLTSLPKPQPQPNTFGTLVAERTSFLATQSPCPRLQKENDHQSQRVVHPHPPDCRQVCTGFNPAFSSSKLNSRIQYWNPETENPEFMLDFVKILQIAKLTQFVSIVAKIAQILSTFLSVLSIFVEIT